MYTHAYAHTHNMKYVVRTHRVLSGFVYLFTEIYICIYIYIYVYNICVD